jgi:hypothetical protein
VSQRDWMGSLRGALGAKHWAPAGMTDVNVLRQPTHTEGTKRLTRVLLGPKTPLSIASVLTASLTQSASRSCRALASLVRKWGAYKPRFSEYSWDDHDGGEILYVQDNATGR